MKKTYVLDTSVLLNAGKSALYEFNGHEVVIPLGVIKQLESHGRDSEFGWIATSVLRELEKLRTEHENNIRTGIPLDHGGTIRIELNHTKSGSQLPPGAKEASNTLLVAHNLVQEKDSQVILVSNDLTQRLTAGALNIEAVPFRRKTTQGDYTGISGITVTKDQLDSLFHNQRIPGEEIPPLEQYPPRHGFIVNNPDFSSSALAVLDGRGDLVLVKDENFTKLPIRGRSAEQRIALHHLLNPSVDIVSLGGPAGTGKTLLALAAGDYLRQHGGDGANFKKIIVFRPLQEVGGQELGFLPGTEEEKMMPWTQAVRDALAVWMDPTKIAKEFAHNNIEVSPATFIRGRTINNAFIIIDEAQNFERLTLLSILSRLGEGSKCVLSWDASQRDNLYINKDDGVIAIIDKMKNEPLVAHITLSKSERSRAARMATRILDEFEG